MKTRVAMYRPPPPLITKSLYFAPPSASFLKKTLSIYKGNLSNQDLHVIKETSHLHVIKETSLIRTSIYKGNLNIQDLHIKETSLIRTSIYKGNLYIQDLHI